MENEQKIQEKDITISAEAEQAVLGCILIDNDTILEVSNILMYTDFFYPSHQAIYKSMIDLYTSSTPIDFLTLTNKLKNYIDIESVGGYEYISKLTSIPDYSKNVNYYSKIVKEKSTLRQLILNSNNIIKDAKSGKSLEDILNLAEKNIFEISSEKSKSDLTHIKEVLSDAYHIIEENYKNKGHLIGISTGLTDLDYITKGWQKTDLILIAARPSVGKTAFALNLALNASKTEKKVAVFSLEMSKTQLVQRLIAIQSKITLNDIKTGDIKKDEDWVKLIDAMSHMSKYDIYINDTAGINLLEIRSQCRKLKMQKGLDLIIIDYLQLMESESKTENRQQEISKISRGLKIMAKELQCPLIALSQLSRASENRSNHIPILSDLRESGAIEQDADIVMFLYRDELYNKDTQEKNITKVKIAKHRNGELATIKLMWQGQYQLFLNLEIEKD